MPYCPRCGTALSSHELGQPDVYRDEEDESAYVRLRLVDPDPAVVGDAESLAVWTTTPWTLLSNTGVAVNPELTYAVVDRTLVADELVDAVMGEGARARVTRAGAGVRPCRAALRAALRRPRPAAGRRRAGASCRPTTSRPRRAPGSCTWPPPSARSTARSGGTNGLPSLNPVGPDGRFTADDRLAGGP